MSIEQAWSIFSAIFSVLNHNKTKGQGREYGCSNEIWYIEVFLGGAFDFRGKRLAAQRHKQSCSEGKEMCEKSVMHVQLARVVVLLIKPIFIYNLYFFSLLSSSVFFYFFSNFFRSLLQRFCFQRSLANIVSYCTLFSYFQIITSHYM